MIYGLGMQELIVILAIVMLLFGGKRLPEVGRSLGKAIRGFKQAEDETMKELKKAAEGGDTEEKPPEGTAEAATPQTSEAAGKENKEEPEGEKEQEGTGEEEADKPA
jgi:sec-independent protein translocase protein TatA